MLRSSARAADLVYVYVCVCLCVQAIAQFDFNAEFKNEMSVKKGDVVDVIEEHPPAGKGWWYCGLNGQTGLCPASYLKIIINKKKVCNCGALFSREATDVRACSRTLWAARWAPAPPRRLRRWLRPLRPRRPSAAWPRAAR